MRSDAYPTPPPPYILAFDVGTSSTRALLFDAQGNPVPHMLAQYAYHLTMTSEGEVSVDPEMLAALVDRTISEVLALAGPLANHITAVALDTFWHGLMGVDANSRPLIPLIIWEDTRPTGQLWNCAACLMKSRCMHAQARASMPAIGLPSCAGWQPIARPPSRR